MAQAQAQAPAKPSAGVIPIPASATQKQSTTQTKAAPKPPTPRLKLVVRRLPPGLTQREFEACLGEDWLPGRGKVDWYQYKPGKVSKGYAVSDTYPTSNANVQAVLQSPRDRLELTSTWSRET